jgi:hypothetical protein
MKAKQKSLQNTIKKSFFLFLVVFAFGCSNELETVKQSQRAGSSKISFEQFIRETGLKDFKTQITSHHSSDITARAADNSYELSDFDIDIDNIKKFVIDEKTTYTFLAKPKIITDRSFFNLTMYFIEGKWETSIVELKPTAVNWEELKNATKDDFDGMMRKAFDSHKAIVNIYSIGNCQVVGIANLHCTHIEPFCSGGVCDGCTTGDDACVTIETYQFCPQNLNDYINPAPEMGGGGGGGTADPVYIDPSGYVFDPLNLGLTNLAEYIRTEHAADFWQSLTQGPDGEQHWAIEHQDQYSVAVNYMLDHYTPELAAFVHEAIEEANNDNCNILDIETLDDQITTTLPPCLDNVINDLKTVPFGKFSQIMQNFVGQNPIPLNYNWNIITGTLAVNEAAHTDPGLGPNSTAITTINDLYTNSSTDLSLAKTIIHEAFHAYLVSVFRNPNITDKSYVNLVNLYYAQFNQNLADTHHHIFTVENMVNEISLALQQYGIIKGYNLPQQFYDDMAWGGLAGTIAFNGLPLTDQIRINSTIGAEFTNSNNNNSQISPSGVIICP